MNTMINDEDYKRQLVAGIDTYIWGLEENAGAPVIFFVHGLGGNVEHSFQYCADLANDGFIAIAIDQRNHGARTVDPTAHNGNCDNYTVKSYGMYVGTSKDISLLIDFLPAALGITTDKFGMSGISLGGHCTLITMGNDPRISVGVPFIGSADRKLQLKIRAELKGISNEEFENSFDPHLDMLMKQYDPVNNAQAFKDRPLCMINGGADIVVDPTPNTQFKEILDGIYICPDRLQFSIYDGVGHEVTDDMWFEARAWFKRFLIANERE